MCIAFAYIRHKSVDQLSHTEYFVFNVNVTKRMKKICCQQFHLIEIISIAHKPKLFRLLGLR